MIQGIKKSDTLMGSLDYVEKGKKGYNSPKSAVNTAANRIKKLIRKR